MADALRAGISRNTLSAMHDAGEFEMLARGLYRLASAGRLIPMQKEWPHRCHGVFT